MNRKTSSIPL